MHFDPEHEGLIEVSTDELRWYEDRERYFESQNSPRRAQTVDNVVVFNGAAEVDPESMFVHEITEYIIVSNPHTLLGSMNKYNNPHPHDVARRIENVNRVNRGLDPWPDD